jgi:hypothetical protein
MSVHVLSQFVVLASIFQKEVSNLMKFGISVLPFILFKLRNLCLLQGGNFLFKFSSRCFVVLVFHLDLYHFKFILVYSKSQWAPPPLHM